MWRCLPHRRGHSKSRIIAACLLAILMIGCSSPARDWETASRTNTIESYAAYLGKYPAGDSAIVARARLANLHWQRAQTEGTADAYRRVLDVAPPEPLVAAVQATLDMAGQFSVSLENASDAMREHCVQSGADIRISVTVAADSGVALLSKLTAQAQRRDGTWIDPAAFVLVRARGITISDNLLLNSCMTNDGGVARFEFDYLEPAGPGELAQERTAMRMMLRQGADLRLRLLYETSAEELTAVRVFGSTIRLGGQGT